MACDFFLRIKPGWRVSAWDSDGRLRGHFGGMESDSCCF